MDLVALDLPMDGALDAVLKRVEAGIDAALDDLKALCRLPGVSSENRALPETAAAVRRLLQEVGVEAREVPTEGGPPVVYGEVRVGDDRPTLLLYNHYDVQPVDPLEEWKTDPFDPVIKDGKLYARGSGDTKGNVVAQVAALRAWAEAADGPPCNLKFVVEGEEEVGSPHFPAFVEAHRDLLQGDGATIEGGEHSMDGVPKVEMGCKGVLYVELLTRTAAVDQHSMWAAILPNAAWRLVHLLGRLRDETGRVLIPGWDDAAPAPTEEHLRHLRQARFDETELLREWGIEKPLVEKSGTELLEHGIFAPTCTLCGLTSGYQGEGTKTVNPAVARAKIDFRLLPGMRSKDQLEKLRRFVAEAGFPDVEVRFRDALEASATPYDTQIGRAARTAAEDVYGGPPSVWPWSLGASAVGFFNETVGVPAIFGPGVSYEGSGYHAPNEHIRLEDFARGTKYFAALMARF